jgi:hypothetical protein
VVQEHGRGGGHDRNAVDHKRSDEPTLEHADPAWDRERVGRVADDVGQHECRYTDPLADRGAREAEDRDVEAEVAKRAEQAPVRADQLALCLPDAVDDRPQRAATSVAVPARAWDRENRSASRQPDGCRDPGQQHSVGAAADSHCK